MGGGCGGWRGEGYLSVGGNFVVGGKREGGGSGGVG